MFHCSVLLGVVFLVCLPFARSYAAFEYCNGTSWIRFQGDCYLIPSTSGSRVSYYDAEDFCQSQGAHLASVHSDAENQFLLNTLEQGRFGNRFWIGLNILDGDDQPKWSDGSAVDFLKKVPKQFYVNEKCFIMMKSEGGWRPEHCALHYAPICKRQSAPTAIPPTATPLPPAGNCKKDWIQLGQKCYKYFGAGAEERLLFKQARDACWALGKNHDLLSIHSMEEQAFLTQHLYDLGTSAWIGMRQVESDEIGHDLVFGWIDNSRSDFTYWANGHPPPGTWKYCGRLSYEGVAKGQWIADYCEIDKQGYICQSPADPDLPVPVPEPSKCSAGYSGFRNSCYRFVSNPQKHGKAEEACIQLGGHLVSIVDSFEQSFLYNFVGRKSSSFWSGLKTTEGTRYLSWTDKQALYYSNWDRGVLMSASEESCVFLDSTRDLRWNVSDCALELPFVCKLTDGVPPSFPETIGACSSSETSWIDIGDEFCYHVAQDRTRVLSWDATSRYCLTKGMKMVKAYSDHQINSLVPYLWKESYGVHLGLIRTFDKKSYVWTDGSQLSYTNWDRREPSTRFDGMDCVAFDQSSGKWKAINCGDGGIALCQSSKLK